MKRAIVFGATGQLGCYSALALKENGYDVFAVGRRKSDGGFFETKGISYIGGFEISNEEAFLKLPMEKFDVVVNMAGTMPAHADMNMMPYVQSIAYPENLFTPRTQNERIRRSACASALILFFRSIGASPPRCCTARSQSWRSIA